MDGEDFDEVLGSIFGERAAGFGAPLREMLFRLWLDGVERGIDLEHVCGEAVPHVGGARGPEGCRACQVLAGDV